MAIEIKEYVGNKPKFINDPKEKKDNYGAEEVAEGGTEVHGGREDVPDEKPTGAIPDDKGTEGKETH